MGNVFSCIKNNTSVSKLTIHTIREIMKERVKKKTNSQIKKKRR